jgi:hypothetical protein
MRGRRRRGGWEEEGGGGKGKLPPGLVVGEEATEHLRVRLAGGVVMSSFAVVFTVWACKTPRLESQDLRLFAGKEALPIVNQVTCDDLRRKGFKK